MNNAKYEAAKQRAIEHFGEEELLAILTTLRQLIKERTEGKK